MRLRKTLTETLMLEEVAGEYETRHYDKTARAYMFGYACSSGFGGSGFSGGGGFRRGRAPNSLIEEVCDFEFQYRAWKT